MALFSGPLGAHISPASSASARLAGDLTPHPTPSQSPTRVSDNSHRPWPDADPPTHERASELAETLSRTDVRAAAERIAGRVRHTPALRVPSLEASLGLEVWVKCENLQSIGAFKARGAMHAVGRIPAAVRARGISTFSSGNHAQAVALAAKAFGISATIYMPEDAPPIKVAGVRALGGQVHFAGLTSEDRRSACLDAAATEGRIVIQPFDHPDIVCGAGTATLEFREQVREATGAELDALIVPVGGGGVIAGACLAARDRKGRAFPIYSAEPEGCDAMAQSLAAGTRVAVEPGPTLADGLKPVRVGELNFEIARRDLAGALTVDDDALSRAMVALLLGAKLLVEPSGAAALAALGRARLDPSHALSKAERVGLILTGGNVDPGRVAQIVASHGELPLFEAGATT